MHFQHQPYGVVVSCSAAIIILAAGCVPGTPPLDLGATLSLGNPLDTETFVGGNAQRLVFVAEDYPDLPPVNLWALVTGAVDLSSLEATATMTPTERVAVVDPVSLEATSPAGATTLSPWATASDGRWLAWIEYDTDAGGVVQVLNLETGAQTQYFQGLAGSLTIAALQNGRLALWANRGVDTYVAVLNLATGEDALLPTNTGVSYQLAARGDWVAMVYYPPPPPPPTSVEDLLGNNALSAANIDVFNLSTGQHATIAGVDAATSLYLTDTQIVWTGFPDGINTTVRAQDLASGQTQDLLTFSSPNAETSTSIEDVGEPGIILHRSSGSADNSSFSYSSHEVFELRAWDGQTLPILDFVSTQDWTSLNPVMPTMRMVGSLIVYRDPTSKDWAIYDTATQTHRTVNPFAP